MNKKLLMKTQIYFASIDQQIGGVGACSVICVLIVGWLHANLRCLPNWKELDALIQQGCDERNRLKKISSLKETFQDGHFDLDCIF